jgi:hypothetical protein
MRELVVAMAALLTGTVSAPAQEAGVRSESFIPPAWSRPLPPLLPAVAGTFAPLAEPAVWDTVRIRPRSVEHSAGYYTRLKIHRIGSYTMLPLFAGEYLLGQRLLDATAVPRWVKPAHTGVALAIGALFASNTVTGAWNFWESRHEPVGRTRRLVHSVLMLAADAGFVYTGAIAQSARRSQDGANRHRNAAIVSMSAATAGTLIMWFWK